MNMKPSIVSPMVHNKVAHDIKATMLKSFVVLVLCCAHTFEGAHIVARK